MSSTGRRELRNKDDFYATPAWATDALIPHLPKIAGKQIMEPCAGEGAIVARILAAEPDALIGAVELDSDRASECRKLCMTWATDFLKLDGPNETINLADIIVMNPPFLLAQEFAEHALTRWLAPGGTCAVLLRLAFMCTKKRAPFRAAHPFDVLALASRPSFTGGTTDSADYAWFLFGDDRGGRLKVLESDKRGRTT